MTDDPSQSRMQARGRSGGAYHDRKKFTILQAEFALRGMELRRSDPLDGRVRLYLSTASAVRQFDSIDLVERLLAVVPIGFGNRSQSK